jgi:tetratricopeptide (TPR) repeat protein
MTTAIMRMRSIIALSLGTILFCANGHAHEATCSAPPSPARVAAGQAFDQKPKDLGALLKLSDALAADSCFDEAVHVLEDGQAVHGRNAELQAHLREARSMLSEQHYFDSLDRAGEAARLSRNLLRCGKLADLQACDDALAQKPGDPGILIAKGDALLQAKRPADALRAYGQAKQVANGDTVVDERVAAAELQRKAFLNACQHDSGDSALRACEGALVRGDADEFEILKRKGILLQAANQSAPALDAYISASLLRHDDRAIALAIVALSESTGRGDALTLAARGSALLTLGRPAEALAPLRQALVLSPGLTDAKAQLARAEQSATAANLKQGTARPTLANAQLAAASEAAPARRYSNTAPITRSN